MSCLDTALACARAGWPTFPLAGKVPAISKQAGGRGFMDATTDEAQLREWFTGTGWNVGMPTGSAVGMWVLDVDTSKDKGGLESIMSLTRSHKLPFTLTVRTGTGGFHLYFAHPGKRVSNRQNLWPGIDVRGDGGYVVIPPSVHPDTGEQYRLVRRAIAAPTPEWMLPLLCPPPPPPPRRAAPPTALPLRQADAERLRRLRWDPGTRERAGLALGGQVVGSGDVIRVRRVRCPSCGRPSVHWFIDPREAPGARCDHRNSCGWAGSVASLLGYQA